MEWGIGDLEKMMFAWGRDWDDLVVGTEIRESRSSHLPQCEIDRRLGMSEAL